MEKAIIKTLFYADIFDYPMSIREIHKWLIGKKANLRQLEKALEKLNQKIKKRVAIAEQNRYYFLPRRENIVRLRQKKAKQSLIYIRKVTVISWLLKFIPWIKLVGVSGGLAMENAGKSDDIDLFIITSKGRLWLSRLLILGVFSLTNQRRIRGQSKRAAAGKICPNILVEEDKLEQKNKNLYSAHEVLQMKVLWERNGIYQKYLEENEWTFRFLPNWTTSNGKWKMENGKLRRKNFQFSILNSQFDWLEYLTKWLQLKIMQKPKGMERIEEGALYFHPKNYQGFIISEYQKKLRLAGLT